MNKADLTISLLRYRMERIGLLQGFSKGEAALMAEQRLKNDGVLGFFGKVKVAGTPEGAIVAIVETFWRAVIQQTLANPAVTQSENGAAKQVMLDQFRNKALSQIEEHRKRFYGGTSDHPKELTAYVIYRIETEIPHMHGIEPKQMGLDRDAISHMVDECNAYFRARVGELR